MALITSTNIIFDYERLSKKVELIEVQRQLNYLNIISLLQGTVNGSVLNSVLTQCNSSVSLPPSFLSFPSFPSSFFFFLPSSCGYLCTLLFLYRIIPFLYYYSFSKIPKRSGYNLYSLPQLPYLPFCFLKKFFN